MSLYFHFHSYWVVSIKIKPTPFTVSPHLAGFKMYTPLEGFLLGTVVTCLYSSNPKYNSQIFFVEKSYLSKLSLMLKLQLPNINPYVVDGIHFSSHPTQWAVQYNFSSMLTDHRLALYTQVTDSTFSLPTLSPIFRSTTWLERELSDFSNLLFEGLLDTRRLLLDYFQTKQKWLTHISNERSYSNTVYEVCVNF